MTVKEAIYNLIDAMSEEGIKPEDGLGTELFLFLSTLAPVINIDLFITDEQGRVLLSWREDEWYGSGWHIPGGCVRFKETLEERVHKTAISELGIDVDINPGFFKLSEHIYDESKETARNEKVREHFISILFECRIKAGYHPNNDDGEELIGHCGWFSKVPDNFLNTQSFYLDFLNERLRRDTV